MCDANLSSRPRFSYAPGVCDWRVRLGDSGYQVVGAAFHRGCGFTNEHRDVSNDLHAEIHKFSYQVLFSIHFLKAVEQKNVTVFP